MHIYHTKTYTPWSYEGEYKFKKTYTEKLCYSLYKLFKAEFIAFSSTVIQPSFSYTGLKT